MNTLTKIASVAIISGGMLLTPIAAQAQTLPESFPVTTREERLQKIKELKDANTARKCTIITNNVKRLIDRYNRTHEQQIDRYNKIKDNIKKAMDRLNELGYDTSKVTTDLQTLNSDILQYNNLHTQFETALNSTTTLVCGKSNGEYVAKVKEAQADLKQMREEAKTIVNFYKNTIRPDIQALKSQKTATTKVQ